MTAIKLDGKPAANASDALSPHARRLFANRTARIIGVVELVHAERTEPAPHEDKEASVKLRIASLEIATADQEDVLRQAQRALYLQRTAIGTLDADGEVELSKSTLALTAGLLGSVETARLRVALRHWAEYARRVLNVPEVTVSEMRHELDTVVSGLEAVLHDDRDDEDGA